MASLENLSAPTDRSSAASQPLSAPADDSIAVPNLVPVVLEAQGVDALSEEAGVQLGGFRWKDLVDRVRNSYNFV